MTTTLHAQRIVYTGLRPFEAAFWHYQTRLLMQEVGLSIEWCQLDEVDCLKNRKQAIAALAQAAAWVVGFAVDNEKDELSRLQSMVEIHRDVDEKGDQFLIAWLSRRDRRFNRLLLSAGFDMVVWEAASVSRMLHKIFEAGKRIELPIHPWLR